MTRGSCFSLLPVVVLLLVILLSSSPSRSHYYFAPVVEAKKDIVNHKVIDKLVPHLKCSVCDAIVVKAYDKTQELFLEQKQRGLKRVNEDEIMEIVLENLCNPHHKDGHWIRLLDIVVSPLDEEGHWKGVFVEPTADYGKCRRECATVAETCNSILRADGADDLSAYLYKNFSEARLKQRMCKSMCADKRMEKLIKKNPPQDDWDLERHEVISSKDLETDTMLDGLSQKAGSNGMPALDVFDRSEMKDLKKAMREGDYDTFAELDPSGNDMSREDFEMMSMWQNAMELPTESEPVETEEEAAARLAEAQKTDDAREAEAKKRRQQEAVDHAESERKKQQDAEEGGPLNALKSALWG